LLQDLVKKPILGVVTEIELLSKSLHNHSWVIILVDLDLFHILSVELDLQYADWLILGQVWINVVVGRANSLLVWTSTRPARSSRGSLKATLLRTKRCVVPVMLSHVALRLLLSWSCWHRLSSLRFSIVSGWDFIHWLLDIGLVLSRWSISLVEDMLRLFLMSLWACNSAVGFIPVSATPALSLA
jgi:hypothetical protein